MDCDNCKHKTCWEYAEPCSSCTNMTGVPTNWEPQTNYDLLISKTPEELAEWIWKETIFCCYRDRDCRYEPCEPCLLRWLKSPAEVDNG